MRLLLGGILAFAAVSILTSFRPGIWTWGLDFWSELPIAARLGALAGLICLMIPTVASSLDRTVGGLFRRPSGLYAGLAVSAVVFLIFRSKGYSYGDGYSFPAYFINGALPEFTSHHWTMALDLVSHWAVYRFVMMPLGGSVELTYAIIGAIGGVASLLAIVRIARLASQDRSVRALTIAAGWSSAVVVFWFGHMESYTLVNAVILWTLAFAIEAQNKPSRIWTAWTFWVLAVAFHQLAVALIPALIYAHWRSGRQIVSDSSPKRHAILFLAGFAGWALATFVYRLVGEPIFVPLLPTADSGYSAFSIAHLSDALNLLVFITPLGVTVLISTLSSRGTSGPKGSVTRSLLLVAAASLWYFAFWVDPLLGAFRDWDLLAAFGLPLALWAGLTLVSAIPKGHLPRWLWVPVAGLALFHCGGYIATLQDEKAVAMRVDRLVRLDPHYGDDFYDGTRLPPWAAIVGRLLERYDLARDHLRKRVTLDPGDALAWANLGNAYQKMQMYDSGAVAYEQATVRDPMNEKFANNLGILYAMQNKPYDARGPFETAASLSDSSYGSRTMLGLIYLQTGEFDRAIKVLNEAIALRPNEFGAFYHRGIYHEAGFDTTAAIADYKAAIANGGNDQEIYRRLVQLLQWSGQISEAVEYAGRWARQFPQSGEAYFLAGTSYILADKYDSASPYLDAAFQRMPQSPMAAYYLATARRNTGQPEQALELANRAIALDSNMALPWLERVYLAVDAGDREAARLATREYLRRAPQDSGMAYLQQFLDR